MEKIVTTEKLRKNQKTKWQKSGKKKSCQYIRIDPDNDNFDGHKALYEISKHIEQLPKKL